jgi:hypothetical protein
MVGLGVVALIVIVGLAIYFVVMTSTKATDEVVIVQTSQRGDKKITYSTPLPDSFNQAEGLVYSYSGWILVNDFTTGYGKKRTILSKDDSPSISLDSTSNSLVFGIQTFGSLETVLVPNIPAAKWIHFALVVNQQAVDIYINGTLRQHHTLSQLPKQNDAAVTMGPDWSGVLGRVSYWPRTLTSAEIQKQAGATPPPDLQIAPAPPQYFDMTWYIGRLNS